MNRDRTAKALAGVLTGITFGALAAGDLHGGQRTKGGHWSIRLECLDAWLDGQPCPHQQQLRAVG